MNRLHSLKYHPETLEDLRFLCDDLSVSLGDIDVSKITDMSNLFCNTERSDFSGIETWDVSQVKNMESMFEYADTFNYPIGNWNMANVESMHRMFFGATNFKQDLSQWKLSPLVDDYEAFYGSGMGMDLTLLPKHCAEHYIAENPDDYPQKPQEKEKLFHIKYQMHNSKKVYEEIIEERFLLDEDIGPLRYICNDFELAPADKLLLSCVENAIDNGLSIKEIRENIDFELKLMDSVFPTQHYEKDLSNLIAVRWVEDDGIHLHIAENPLELVNAVFQDIKDADCLEIHEVTPEEAKKIERRIEKANERKKYGLAR